MLVPLIILSIGAMFAGYFFKDLLAGYDALNFWKDVIYLNYEKNDYSSFYPILSKSLVAMGILFAVYFYGFNLERLKSLKIQFQKIYQFVLNKWYFDELYNKIFVKPVYNFGHFLWTRIDQGLIDKFLPNGSASLVALIAKKAKKIQSGFIFDYTFIIITGFTLFISIIFYVSVS